MQFGIHLPAYSKFSDPRLLLDLGQTAEAAGWDGVFLWDDLITGGRSPVADSWTVLAALAATTRRVRIGVLISSLARRRPWKVARELTTLDQISGGRVVLGVGLGQARDFARFGEEADDRLRAAKLDEGLEIIDRLWTGEPVDFRGEHYRLSNVTFRPTPLQRPRIPVWVAGRWPNRRPLRRAARWDGVFPIGKGPSLTTMLPPQTMAAIGRLCMQQRSSPHPFDLVHWGLSAGDGSAADRALVNRYAEVGVTWWLENLNQSRGSVAQMRSRIQRGPPLF